jgi:hypothetical protein
MAASSLLGLAVWVSERLNETRSWVLPPWVSIPSSLAVQISFAIKLQQSTAVAASTYSLVIQSALYILQLGLFIVRGRDS